MADIDNQQSVTRRQLLGTGAVACGIAVTGCVGGSGDSIAYISRGGATHDAEREVMAEWSEESDIEVTHQEVADDTEMLELIDANPEEFDFTNPVPAAFAQHSLLYDEELFTEIDFGEIPNYSSQ